MRGNSAEDKGGSEEGRREVQSSGEQDEERRGRERERTESSPAEAQPGKEQSRCLQQETERETAGTFQLLRHVSGSRLTKLHCVYTGCVTSQQLEAEHLLFLNHLSPSFSRRQTQ